MTSGDTLDIIADRDGTKYTYRFQRHLRPTLMALSCVTGPVLFFPEKGEEAYADPNMLLSDLPRRRVVLRDYTTELLARYREFYSHQSRALLQDLDERYKRAPSGSAQAREIEQQRASLLSTIEK